MVYCWRWVYFVLHYIFCCLLVLLLTLNAIHHQWHVIWQLYERHKQLRAQSLRDLHSDKILQNKFVYTTYITTKKLDNTHGEWDSGEEENFLTFLTNTWNSLWFEKTCIWRIFRSNPATYGLALIKQIFLQKYFKHILHWHNLCFPELFFCLIQISVCRFVRCVVRLLVHSLTRAFGSCIFFRVCVCVCAPLAFTFYAFARDDEGVILYSPK